MDTNLISNLCKQIANIKQTLDKKLSHKNLNNKQITKLQKAVSNLNFVFCKFIEVQELEREFKRCQNLLAISMWENKQSSDQIIDIKNTLTAAASSFKLPNKVKTKITSMIKKFKCVIDLYVLKANKQDFIDKMEELKLSLIGLNSICFAEQLVQLQENGEIKTASEFIEDLLKKIENQKKAIKAAENLDDIEKLQKPQKEIKTNVKRISKAKKHWEYAIKKKLLLVKKPVWRPYKHKKDYINDNLQTDKINEINENEVDILPRSEIQNPAENIEINISNNVKPVTGAYKVPMQRNKCVIIIGIILFIVDAITLFFALKIALVFLVCGLFSEIIGFFWGRVPCCFRKNNLNLPRTKSDNDLGLSKYQNVTKNYFPRGIPDNKNMYHG